jgi:phospholipase/lecithinase/hemolysin
MTLTPPRAGWLAACATLLAALAACGGGSDGDQTPAVTYSRLVAFGDSLSDVGSYATPGVLASGGGRYTVNSPTARNWVEQLAAQAGVAAPCAAVTGLEASATLAGLAGPIAEHPDCTGYAQGGARVTDPIGPANKALLLLTPPNTDGALGQLTYPLVRQVQMHLDRSGDRFAADELVTVLAGGNDLFMQVAILQATVQAAAAGGATPAEIQQATATAAQAAGAAMAGAGQELALLIRNQIVAKGARRVVVVNLPDVSLTPYALEAEQSAPGSQALVRGLVQAFNGAVAAGTTGLDGVLMVDAYTQSQDQAVNPAPYGLTNVTQASCLSAVPTALLCNTATVVAGDVSHYLYADDVHPTPFGYQLLARFVALQMVKAGWL